jgi:hypothetical protein
MYDLKVDKQKYFFKDVSYVFHEYYRCELVSANNLFEDHNFADNESFNAAYFKI